MRHLLALLVLFLLTVARPAVAGERPNLVLISLDTTRADALSCYGRLPGMRRDVGTVTPHLDAIAAAGVRFERFYAHAPTTLNSHTSMLSGLDPHQHGVPRNGFVLPDGLPTLATRLGDVGYDTIAILAAQALEEDMGLSQGFRVYDDRVSERQGPMYQDRADGVVDRTLEALASRDPEQPLFLMVHFYDPHAPYAPPAPFDTRFAPPGYDGPYDGESLTLGRLRRQLIRGRADPADVEKVASLYLGEVAYVDQQVGRLLAALEAQGLLDHALVVITADHGETLSDEPLYTYSHGTDVGDGAMRVPLLMRGYGVPLAEGAVVERQAPMKELAPTLERLLGLEPTLGDAHDFWELVRPGPVHDVDGWPERPTRTVLMEATRPRARQPADSWNNLWMWRAIRAGGFVASRAPAFREALRLGIHSDRHDGPSALVDLLGGLLDAWDAAAPPHRVEEMDEHTRAALEALGYLD